MDVETFTTVICAAGLFGMMGGMILIAYEDGVPQGRLKKILCLFNRHKFHLKIGKTKNNKYYCQWCKKPRTHPALKVVDGGYKIGNNKYNF